MMTGWQGSSLVWEQPVLFAGSSSLFLRFSAVFTAHFLRVGVKEVRRKGEAIAKDKA